MNIKEFFQISGGAAAKLYQLRNAAGFGVDVTDFGGALVSLYTFDRSGRLLDVALGFDDPADYETNDPFFGALIGRVANRIRDAKFTLDGVEYHLPRNREGSPHSLHGGESYAQRLWRAEELKSNTLALHLKSPDGDAGYPGNLEVTVVYMVTDANELIIDYTARTDRPTVVGMTNHAYFNLAGQDAGDCLDHSIRLVADRRTEADETLAMTGRYLTVAGTPYDLRQGRKFTEIFADLPHGLDDNYILADVDGVMKKDVAVVRSERSGVEMRVATTAPGLQFYMGYFLDGDSVCKGGTPCRQFGGFCLEAQPWPDAVNQPDFPSIRLDPGAVYRQITVYEFHTR